MRLTNQQYLFSNFNSSRAVAIIFTSNTCPYAKLYEQRLLNLHSKYSDSGLVILLINPNSPLTSPDDEKPKMKDHAIKMKYPFPYLIDSDQKISRLFGAKKTPEAFLLKPSGGVFTIVYKGSIDDNPQNPADVRDSYLNSAIEMAIKDEKVTSLESRPVGCMIKT